LTGKAEARPVQCTVSPLRSEGQIRGLVMAFADVS